MELLVQIWIWIWVWDITTGGLSPSGDTIVVCVIDDGINQAHEDLKDNIWYNQWRNTFEWYR